MESTEEVFSILGVSTAIAAAGLALDELLLKRQANSIRSVLTTFWVHIEDLRIRDVPVDVARIFVSCVDRIFGSPTITLRWIARSVFVSVVLTSLSILAPFVIQYVIFNFFLGNFLGDLDKSEVRKIYFYMPSLPYLIEYVYKLRPFYIYPINYVFDFATVYITYGLAKAFITTKSVIVRALLVVVDFVGALALAIGCYFVCVFVVQDVWELHRNGDAWGGLLQAIGAKPLYSPVTDTPHSKNFEIVAISRVLPAGSVLFYSATTLLPTAVYLIILSVALLAVLTIRTVKFVVLQTLALSIETDKSIFFYTGALLALINIVVRLVGMLL